jgi:hypothetical protein
MPQAIFIYRRQLLTSACPFTACCRLLHALMLVLH